ncbi:MAG: thioredoxin family protein [Limnohabitans sp.]|nr:thioredoxin family protein [Limnohabitans sp.]
MKAEIAKGLLNAVSYPDYRKKVSDLLAQDLSSGNEQTEDLLAYSKLNETRMNRLDKTIVVPDEIATSLKSLKHNYTWLVLAEGWCGDAAQIVPVLFKMASVTDKIDLKIVFRDENDDLMNVFLTNGARAIPKVIILDNEHNEFKSVWGPRPEGAANLIKSYKAQYGVVDQTAKTELQLWYLHDKGLSMMNELVSIMIHSEELIHQKI